MKPFIYIKICTRAKGLTPFPSLVGELAFFVVVFFLVCQVQRHKRACKRGTLESSMETSGNVLLVTFFSISFTSVSFKLNTDRKMFECCLRNIYVPTSKTFTHTIVSPWKRGRNLRVHLDFMFHVITVSQSWNWWISVSAVELFDQGMNANCAFFNLVGVVVFFLFLFWVFFGVSRVWKGYQAILGYSDALTANVRMFTY